MQNNNHLNLINFKVNFIVRVRVFINEHDVGGSNFKQNF